MAGEINQIEYGKLLASVEHLSTQVSILTHQVSELRDAQMSYSTEVNSKLKDIDNRFGIGKFTLGGAIFGAAAIGYGVKSQLGELLRWIFS